ncbi:hypothetical protein [Agrobacterium vaccinii]|uniref:hypothetical protein n=1 Tax=Agrobacterium vaccinii TaxID=2735528 RepID=UPI001E2D641C|nr:hypothetical protein [Agrobacterium vaccinii]UHS55712.1 hypothetical protein HRS00_02210 [Agrobacterium vaccinii]
MLLEMSYPAASVTNATTLAVLTYDDPDGYANAQSTYERWREHLPATAFAIVPLPHAPELPARLAVLEKQFGLPKQRMALIGFGSAADKILCEALKSEDKFAAIISFNMHLENFAMDCKSLPPVFLVHGGLNPHAPPANFLKMFHTLSETGIPVSICFRPEAGLELTSSGLLAAMYFLQGAFAALGPFKAAEAQQSRENLADRAKSIKAIIWDLDDTLWDGTLDDIGALSLKAFRVETIKRLNKCGLISAICSKNDFDTAKAKLIELGIWDEFVFPRIAFVPKGDALKSMISDMQLRPKNCLFIDDNAVNLAEACAALPDLQVLDATAADCDVFLQTLLDAHGNVTKSRLDDYRALENRVSEDQLHGGSREDFLKSCDIRVAIARESDVVDFAHRIEELINRTNQLNFLKTRVEPGSMARFLSESSLRMSFALFAWDKFGYHGLVGFIAVDVRENTLLHMTFSCRIMHMGMENLFLAHVMEHYPNLKVPPTLTIEPTIPSWITQENYNAAPIRALILDREKNIEVDPAKVKIRFMAHCHSGTFAHFSGLRDIAEIDNYPRVFALPLMLRLDPSVQNFPDFLVYHTGIDYMDMPWPEEERAELETKLYPFCAEKLAQFLQENGKRMLVICSAAPDGEEFYSETNGITKRRLKGVSDAWAAIAEKFDCVDLMDVDSIVGADGMVDVLHFKVESSEKIAKEIARWYWELNADQTTQKIAAC